MADQSDVETALATLIGATLYPNGAAAASALPGAPLCRIHRGWPNAPALDADLAAGAVTVSVFADPHAIKDTTRFPERWEIVSRTVPTLTVSVSGTTATFAGRVTGGEIAGLLVGQQGFSYPTKAGDTPALVAAALAAEARAAGVIATVTGASVSVPWATRFDGRVVGSVAALKEVRRQEQLFRVTCWCPTAALRDATAAMIDVAIAPIRFLALADGSSGWVRFAGTTSTDQAEAAQLYRRDLVYRIDYPTTLAETEPEMLFGLGRVLGPDGLLTELLS